MSKRRDLLRFAAGFPALAALGAVSGESKLPDAVFNEQQAKLTREPFGDLRIYFSGPTGQIKSMTAGSLLLKPGMTPHPPHTHSEEEFMVITQGTGEISLEGKIVKVSPGSMMYCGGGKLHGIVNTGKTSLLFYFYKWQA